MAVQRYYFKLVSTCLVHFCNQLLSFNGQANGCSPRSIGGFREVGGEPNEEDDDVLPDSARTSRTTASSASMSRKEAWLQGCRGHIRRVASCVGPAGGRWGRVAGADALFSSGPGEKLRRAGALLLGQPW